MNVNVVCLQDLYIYMAVLSNQAAVDQNKEDLRIDSPCFKIDNPAVKALLVMERIKILASNRYGLRVRHG